MIASWFEGLVLSPHMSWHMEELSHTFQRLTLCVCVCVLIYAIRAYVLCDINIEISVWCESVETLE